MLTDSGVPAFSQGPRFAPSSGRWMSRNYHRGKSRPQFGIPRALEPPPRTVTATALAVKLDVSNSNVGSATGEADFNTIRRSLFPRKPVKITHRIVSKDGGLHPALMIHASPEKGAEVSLGDDAETSDIA